METGDDSVSAARMPDWAIEKAEAAVVVVVVVVGKHHFSPEVQLFADPTVLLFAIANQGQLITFAQTEPLRSSLHELEIMLENTVHS